MTEVIEYLLEVLLRQLMRSRGEVDRALHGKTTRSPCDGYGSWVFVASVRLILKPLHSPHTSNHELKRVAVVDTDVHQGDGSQDVFLP